MAEYCTISYNETPITINAQYFAEASSFFAQHYVPQSNFLDGEQLAIGSKTPLEHFQIFLPAVQRQPYRITEENVDIFEALAQEWGVDSVQTECRIWRGDPAAILKKFIHDAAEKKEHGKDKNGFKDVIEKIAQHIDEYLELDSFMLIPPRYITEIVNHPKLNVTNKREFFKVLLAIINLRRERCSEWLNKVDVDVLTEEDILTALRSKRIEANLAGPFIVKCARKLQMFLKDAKVTKHRPNLDNDLEHATKNLRFLEKKFIDIKREHEADTEKLDAMIAKYEDSPAAAPIPMYPMMPVSPARHMSAPATTAPAAPLPTVEKPKLRLGLLAPDQKEMVFRANYNINVERTAKKSLVITKN